MCLRVVVHSIQVYRRLRIGVGMKLGVNVYVRLNLQLFAGTTQSTDVSTCWAIRKETLSAYIDAKEDR